MTSIICNSCGDQIKPQDKQLYLPTRTLCAFCANFATRDEVLKAEEEKKERPWRHEQETRALNSCTQCGHYGIILTVKRDPKNRRQFCAKCAKERYYLS